MPKQQSAYVKKRIEELRNRLLDLGLRNKLIQFRHNARHKTFIRIVDTRPADIFSRLCEDEKECVFKSLPDQAANADEETPEFKDALRRTRMTDEEYQRERTEWENQEEPSQVQEERIERRLRDRVRELLGMPSVSKAKQDPIAFARELGINPDFDLQGSSVASRSHRQLQTLYSATELKQRLKKVADQYESSIQERGINTLFLALGFVEWTASETSDSVILSPLLLLRLELDKKKPVGRNQEGKIEVCIRAESNETIYNASLAAKLKKDFQYILPERKADEPPERFFERVERSFPKSRDWKLRRFATVCHLSFQKITLYEDLGKERWKVEPLYKQRLLEKVISGDRDRGSGEPRYSDDYAIDHLPDRDIVDLLVRDADSSQHSALVDALEGKDLVIEGPPGTGKSQTITNLIAACMQRGKSVLFVAEKLAALQIVKNRLDDCKCRTRDGNRASLGDFCLELHSNKIRRTAVHQSIKKRLDLRGKVKPPKDFEDRRKKIWMQRQRMRGFLDWLHNPVAQTELSFFEIIWGESRASDALGELTGCLSQIYIPKAESLTPEDRTNLHEAVAEYGSAYFSLKKSCGDLDPHPWLWVENAGLGRHDTEALFRQVESFSSQFGDWHQYLKGLCVQYDWPPFGSFAEVIALLKRFYSLVVPNIDPDVLERFTDPEFSRAIEEELHSIKSFRAEIDGLSRTLSNPAALLGWAELSGLLQDLKQFAQLPVKTKTEIRREISRWQIQIGWVDRMEESLSGIDQLLPASTPSLSLATIDALLATCDGLAGLGDELLDLIGCGFAEPGSRIRWKSIMDQWCTTKAKVAEYSDRMARLDDFEAGDLRANATLLQNCSFWQSLFSKEVKAAKKVLRSLYIGSTKLDRKGQVEFLRDAADCKEQIQTLECNPNGRLLPTHVSCSISSDFSKLEVQLQVVWDIQHQLAQHPNLHEFLTKLQSMEIDRARSVIGRFRTSEFREAFSSAMREWEDDLNTPLEQLRRRARENLTHAENLHSIAEQLKLKNDVPVNELRAASDTLTELIDAKAEIESGVVPPLSGNDFSAIRSDLSALQSTLNYRRSIDEIGIPGEHQTSLFAREATSWLEKVCEELAPVSLFIAEMEAALAGIQASASGTPLGIDPETSAESDLSAIESWLTIALENEDLLYDHLAFIYCSQKVSELSVQSIVSKVRDEATDLDSFDHAVDYVLFRSILKDHQGQQKLKLTRSAIEGYQKQFCQLDLELQELTIQRIVEAQDRTTLTVPPGIGYGPKADWTELYLVELEAGKQKRHRPLREYLSAAGESVRQLMPCMMMSPQTVAEFLEPRRELFDIVIIDEASQMRPEEAISALGRGKHLVVVGDDKQLPPTSFFMASENDEEGEEAEEDKAESILEMAAVTFDNVRRLRWHYRSKHDSLIQYSNQEFYDDQLVVFPSPIHAGNGLGIRYHYTEGSYHEGLNEKEAEAVLSLVAELMRSNPRKSIGVATMNSKQRELIMDQINEISEYNPTVARYVSEWEDKLEYFFVKNLENVQGDERDIIVISTVYGRPADGSNPRQISDRSISNMATAG